MFYTFIATDPCYNEYTFKVYRKKENAVKAFESAAEEHFGLPFDTLRTISDEIESHKGTGEYEAFYTGDDDEAAEFVSEFNQPVITEDYASVLVEDGAFLMTWAVEKTEFEDQQKEDHMNFLELVDMYMDEYGMDEDTACRCALYDTNPEAYCADDYDA